MSQRANFTGRQNWSARQEAFLYETLNVTLMVDVTVHDAI